MFTKIAVLLCIALIVGCSNHEATSNGQFIMAGNLGEIDSVDMVQNSRATIHYPKYMLNAITVNKNGKFAAVGQHGVILYSSDGLSWKAATTNTASIFFAITVNNSGKFIAVGDNGVVASSMDGENYTVESSGTKETLTGIAVNAAGKFIIVGLNGMILSSENGSNWVIVAPIIANDLLAISVNNAGKFVAVGTTGTIISSVDGGETWISEQSPTDVALRGITINNDNIWAIVGDQTTILTSNVAGIWNIKHHKLNTQLLSVAANKYGKFIATSISNTLYVSIDDGETWSTEDTTVNDMFDGIVADSNGRFVAVGGEGINPGAIVYSNGSAQWGMTKYLTSSAINRCIGYHSQSVVAVGRDGLILRSLDDGDSWSQVRSGTSLEFFGVAADNVGAFVAVGANGMVAHSTDAEHWSVGFLPTPTFTAVAHSSVSGMFVAVGALGVIASSVDGYNWVVGNSHTTEQLYDIAVDQITGQFITVGQDGTILSSFDAVNWQIVSGISSKYEIYGITNNGKNQFIAVGYNGLILQTTDAGNTWIPVLSGTANSLNKITTDEYDNLIVVGSDGAILSKSHNKDWIVWPMQNGNSLFTVCKR